MQLPFQPKAGGKPGRPPQAMGARVACTVFGVVAVLAWSFPATKDNAVLGYLDYAQFWFAVFASVAALSAFVVGLLPQRLRRPVGFRLGALGLGTVVALGLLEALAYFLPVRSQMDNPWYFAAGGGVSESVELPFERPPHLKWEGLSRGDLALLNNDPDPYARIVTFQTDRQGFRNGEELQQADVVVIGDSFAEAGNVPEAESFAKLIGRKLAGTSRNLGRAGYSPPTELIVLRKYGLACQPKVVVWQIAESNDLSDCFSFSKWVEAGRPRFFDFEADRSWQRTQAWQQRSPTFRAFDQLRHHDPRPWPYDGWFRDHAGVEHPMRFLETPDLQGSLRDSFGWPTLAESLANGAALCRSNQIQLLVVLVPDKYRVMGPYTRFPNRTSPPPASTSDPSYQQTLGGLLKSLCGSLGVPFLDATGGLEARASRGEIVYQPFDTHLSSLGHEVIAELVVARLKTLAEEATSKGPADDHPSSANLR